MRHVAHGYFAYVNEISFAYPEHLVHGGVAITSKTTPGMNAEMIYEVIFEVTSGVISEIALQTIILL